MLQGLLRRGGLLAIDGIDRVLRWLKPSEETTAAMPLDGKKLIHRVDLTMDASCPCGSQLIHHLTLMTTVECPRCGRTLAIRSIEYHRTSPAAVPDLIISIGWVQSDELLRRVRTRGVH